MWAPRTFLTLLEEDDAHSLGYPKGARRTLSSALLCSSNRRAALV